MSEIIDLKKRREGKTASVVTDSSTFFRIKSRNEIAGLLNKAYKSHTLLSITVGSSDQIFGSVILEINKDKSYMLLDELYPRKKFHDSLINQKLSVEAQLHGILLNFSCLINEISEEDGSEYYKVNLPDFLYYHQRRENYRVPISITQPLPADLETENDIVIHAELRDLSLGGLSARLTTPQSEELKIGDIIPACTIQLPNNRKIECSVEIVRIDEAKTSRNVKIGAKFTDISNADRQELSRAIAILERLNIKKLKRNRSY